MVPPPPRLPRLMVVNTANSAPLITPTTTARVSIPPIPPLEPNEDLDAAKAAANFLVALFGEQDTVLFRPIETWTENGRKRSRVDYKHTYYRRAESYQLHVAVWQLLRLAKQERLNIFFGVCPRFGSDGRYDLAWQIRTVRALWTDIDNITVEEAGKRIEAAGLPQPSAIVNSGKGVHLYWFLDAPYQIDDAADPVPVETEWIKSADSNKKKPRKYIVEHGDKVYLDQRQHVSRLSPKAEHIQDIVAGIAKLIGGDHTTDVSRLLRVPFTPNRKDQQNGREPLSTTLADFDPLRRYPLSLFESFKALSPITEKARKIASMSLPTPRKPSQAKADKLAELIDASAIAEPGERSEADFSVCCYAVRNGIAKDKVWSQVANVGKFANQGERYFNLTWDNAEYDARSRRLDKLTKDRQTKRAASRLRLVSAATDDESMNAEAEGAISNNAASVVGDPGSGNGRPVIFVDTSTTPVADTLSKVTDTLLAAGNNFIRAKQLVSINEPEILPVLTSAQLGGLLNQLAELYFAGRGEDESGEFKVLPPAYANTWLNKPSELARLPSIQLFTHNPVFTAESWELTSPGYNAKSGIYYSGFNVEARSDTKRLDVLLKEFCFKDDGSCTNYVGMLLTALLVPMFIGSKPAAMFTGNQANLGKSILAQTLGILRDGAKVETVSYNPNDEEFEKSLGAVVNKGATTIIIDNAKSRGRNPRIESACLERSITDPVLSFRLLGHSALIRAENSHTFCITANTPEVSHDLITRSVIVNLYYEGDPKRRKFAIPDPEGYAQEHRIELLGELIGMVEKWKASGMPRAATNTRFNKRAWGDIVGGILAANGRAGFLNNADEAAVQLDEDRKDFSELASILAVRTKPFWTPTELAELCNEHGLLKAKLGEGSPRSRSTKMGNLASQFINEPIPLPDSDTKIATFKLKPDRKGNTYMVGISDKNAEP